MRSWLVVGITAHSLFIMYTCAFIFPRFLFSQSQERWATTTTGMAAEQTMMIVSRTMISYLKGMKRKKLYGFASNCSLTFSAFSAVCLAIRQVVWHYVPIIIIIIITSSTIIYFILLFLLIIIFLLSSVVGNRIIKGMQTKSFASTRLFRASHIYR